MQIEQEGRYWNVRIGDRSSLPSKYTSHLEAEKALKRYKENVANSQAKTAARKTRSDKGKTKSTGA